ncbi:hypothetical protein VA249_45160 (plasmid) [Vibrio alfacsensis]|uniref:conjugal transfer protein TraG N-terminal domain-containing protein n=1 Tax=Vibrio alfacsensis TaxID=1074311 RepID=UPI001BEFD3C9|nr:conjugal transfer protein TraG N-terminal domain-containing protein [Vibrio alfacsensis]BBM67870.1 hypothetical protein VA249_45160 [Vibrio alfacsensis]
MAIEWNIVSFGDVVVLQTVFNAVAAISANATYKAAAAAVALFVFVIAMSSSLTDGKQELPIPRLFAAFLLYAMGFNTLTTVSIENRYEGTVSTIDNIPVAIAVPASLISNIGLELVELSETAFGNNNAQVRISERGYLSPLKTLAEYRAIAYKSCPAGDGNSVLSGYKFCPSFRNYIRDCAMVKAKRDGLTRTMKEGDFFENIAFNSNAFSTLLIRSNNVREEKSCKEAYAKIIQIVNSGDFDAMYANFNGRLGVRIGEDAESVTSDILASIGADAAKSRNLMKTIMANKLAEDGELSFYFKNKATDYAENLQSSIEQRNYGWVIQGEMWIQLVNQFITIMECLLFAITPFIGLMVLCGSTGPKTAMLYLQMMAVIQFIPMLLVVAQNVIMMQMNRAVIEIAMQYDTGSIEYMNAVFEKAKELLGLGGMVSATIVPAMAMSLVTGSGMAMMGAMKGAAAPAKDTDATPEIAKQGGPIEDWSKLNNGTRDAYGNTMTDSAESRVGNITRSLANSSAVNDSRTAMNAAQKTYQEATENALTSSNGNTFGTNELLKSGQTINSGASTMRSFAEKELSSLADNYNLQGQEKNEFIQAMSAGLNLGLGGRVAEQYANSLSSSVSEAYQHATSGESGIALQAKFDEAKSAAYEKGETVSTNNSEIDANAQRVSEARQEVESTTEQYQNAVSATDTASIMNDDVRMGLSTIGNDQHVKKALNEKIDENRDNEQWMARFSQNFQEMSGGVNGTDLDDDSAKLAAFMITNNEHSKIADNQEVLSEFSGHQPLSSEQLRNSGINHSLSTSSQIPETPNHGDVVRKEVESPTKGVVPNSLGVDKNDPLSSYRNEIQGHFNRNANDVERFGTDYFSSDKFADDRAKLNELKGKLGINEDTDIVPLERTQEYISDSIAGIISGDSPLERVNNAYDYVRAAYYDSPVGEAELKATEYITEKYNQLTSALENIGADENQGSINKQVNAFIDDVGTELSNLFTTDNEHSNTDSVLPRGQESNNAPLVEGNDNAQADARSESSNTDSVLPSGQESNNAPLVEGNDNAKADARSESSNTDSVLPSGQESNNAPLVEGNDNAQADARSESSNTDSVLPSGQESNNAPLVEGNDNAKADARSESSNTDSVLPSGQESNNAPLVEGNDNAQADARSESSNTDSVLPSGQESNNAPLVEGNDNAQSDVRSESSNTNSVLPRGQESNNAPLVEGNDNAQSDVRSESSNTDSVLPSGQESNNAPLVEGNDNAQADVRSESSNTDSVLPRGQESNNAPLVEGNDNAKADARSESSNTDSVLPSGQESNNAPLVEGNDNAQADARSESSNTDSVLPSGQESNNAPLVEGNDNAQSDVRSESSNTNSVLPRGQESNNAPLVEGNDNAQSDVRSESSNTDSVLPSGQESNNAPLVEGNDNAQADVRSESSNTDSVLPRGQESNNAPLVDGNDNAQADARSESSNTDSVLPSGQESNNAPLVDNNQKPEDPFEFLPTEKSNTNYPLYDDVVNQRNAEIEKELIRDEIQREHEEQLLVENPNYDPVDVNQIPR